MMADPQKFDVVKRLAPQARTLEGYLYPSTYEFEPGTQPAAIIERLVDQFGRTWKPEWAEKARAMGRTPHEIVTIASLIETESKFDAERPIVASVIYNRLSKSIPLGIDQTNVYIAKMEGRWDGTIHKSDLEVDSPYNTRKRAGLPPGPISSVSVSSIEAACCSVRLARSSAAERISCAPALIWVAAPSICWIVVDSCSSALLKSSRST